MQMAQCSHEGFTGARGPAAKLTQVTEVEVP